MRIAVVWSLLMLWLPGVLIAQVSTISGNITPLATVVNTVDGVGNNANVTSITGFAVGDTVLLIQMQGAEINTNNSASFGDITNINNAGKYEFNIICSIDTSGSNIMFQNQLLNAYDPGGSVQLLRIQTYDDVIVSGTLTADPWNGATGGVLVVYARGYLRLFGGTVVMMDRTGFRGGDHLIIGDPCGCGVGDPVHAEFSYPYNDYRGAHKGEGVAGYTSGFEGGKGKNATGGGGGNDHNGGGAGGANYGVGGDGGQPCQTRSCFFFGQYCRGFHPGVGSVGMAGQYTNANNRIFLGGGGGAGDDNGGAGSGGANGGGIVIFVSDSLAPINANVFARGGQPVTGAGDGAGGGGAGGTVLVNTRTIHPTQNLNVFVSGGQGGLSSWSVTSSNHNSKGKGGGGGGGVLWYSGATIPANVNVFAAGGPAGYEVAATACQNSTGGATDGGDGAELTGLNLRMSSSIVPSCLLPVEYGYITAEEVGTMSRIRWSTLEEVNNDRFEIERSFDGSVFQAIVTVPAHGSAYEYEVIDPTPHPGPNFYRIRQIDLNGSFRTSKIVTVNFNGGQSVQADVFPNPVRQSDRLKVRLSVPMGEIATVNVHNALGKIVFHKSWNPVEAISELEIPLSDWQNGVYFMTLKSSGSKVTRRIVVME